MLTAMLTELMTPMIEDRPRVTVYTLILTQFPGAKEAAHHLNVTSMEAEHRSVASVTAEIIWIETLIGELGFNLTKKPLTGVTT